MTVSNGTQPHQTRAIDWLFTHCAGGEPLLQTPAPPGWQPAGPPAPPGEPEAPPEFGAPTPNSDPTSELKGEADLKAAAQWLRRERRRLEDYTRAQLARVQREHQTLLSQNYLNEQALILRVQEVSRKEELLAQQAQALRQQAEELSGRERALAEQLEQWQKAHEELAALWQANASMQQDAEAQKALVDALRGETAALQRSREAARSELDALARALAEQREARAKEQALFAATRAKMEQRLRELDRAESATQRRAAELDELEARLREEYDEEERRLARERADLEALAARLRQRAEEVRTTPPARGELQGLPRRDGAAGARPPRGRP